MSKKIFISPSNQVNNAYASGNTTEGAQMGELGKILEQDLIRCGFETKLMHMESMQAKCTASNEWNADAHICLHSNAFNNQVMGTRILPYSSQGRSNDLCRAIGNYLFPLSPGQSDNYNSGATLYENRTTYATAAYIETEFHDVAAGARWIIENKEAISEAICKGICDYYGVKFVPKSPAPSPEPAAGGETLYCVQIGAYKTKANAEKQAAKAKAAGFEAYIWQK